MALYIFVYLKYFYILGVSLRKMFSSLRSSDFLFKTSCSRGKGIHLYMTHQNDLVFFCIFKLSPLSAIGDFDPTSYDVSTFENDKEHIIKNSSVGLSRLLYQIPQTGWLIKSGNLFPTLVEAGGPQSRCWQIGVGEGTLPGLWTAFFLLCPHMVEGETLVSSAPYKGTNLIQEGSAFVT